MKNNIITCPVCGQSAGNSSAPARCGTCGTGDAFQEYFSSEQAFSAWQQQMQEARKRYRTQKQQELRSHGSLTVGPEFVAFHDSGSAKLTVVGRDGAAVTDRVRAYSASNLHQLTLSTRGKVTARGDSEAGQGQVGDLTGITHILAAPRCSYLVDQNGTVTARGACAIKPQLRSWSGIQALACGTQHLVGLRDDGTVLQADDSVAGRTSAETAAWKNVTAIAAAGNYTLGLHADGTVSYAGPQPDARQEVSKWRNIVAIAADYHYAVGLTEDGRVLLAGNCVRYLDGGRSEASQWSDVVCIAAGYGVIAGLDGSGNLLLAGSLLGDAQIRSNFSQANPVNQ